MNVRVSVVVAAAVAASVVAGVVVAPAAHAADAPAVSAVSVAGDGPGDLVRATGTGFTPGSRVDVVIAGADTYPLVAVTADPAGTVALPADTRVPVSVAPGRYTVVFTGHDAGPTASSPTFLVRPPQAFISGGVQAGRPADNVGSSGIIWLEGLANGPDVTRTVTVDGTAVDTLWFGDSRAFARPDLGYATPAGLTVGQHRVTFTQSGSTPYTTSALVTVGPPELHVEGGRSSAGSIGVAVWNSGYLDVVDLTITGAAGDVHTREVDGDVNGVGASFDLPHVSPGVATITSVSRHNGATATTTFTIDPTTVASPGGLASGARVVNADGSVQVVMQGDGNLVLYSYSLALWNSRTAGHPGATLVVQPDGNAVVRGKDGRALWNSGTNGIGSGARFGLDTSNNLTVFAASGRKAWSNFSFGGQFPPRLAANQYLFKDQSLTSYVPRIAETLYAKVQSDGNFVVTPSHHAPTWSTRTQGHANAYLLVQNDGNLVVRAPNGSVLWSNGVHALGAYVVAQSDGNVVEYAPNGRALWSTRTVIR